MFIMRRSGSFIFAVAACLLAGSTGAKAGQIYLNGLAVGSGNVTVPVQSFQARKFNTTIKQQYDFSCGSAALATLLTFTYHMPSSESDVFINMYDNGDKSLIREYGFSLLDMKNYLSRIGLPSGGFKAPISKLASIRVPAIVLINEHGYRHFVVIRGIQNNEVLLADPAIGLRTEPLHEFEQQWSGIFFVVLSHVQTAQEGFNGEQDWSAEPGAPTDLARFAVTLATLQQVTMQNPNRF